MKTINWAGREVPEILYKYRTWSNPFHQNILSDLQVYIPAPTEFEDELDCRNNIRYDLLTNEQIYQKYFQISRANNPHYSLEQHVDFANHWYKISPMHDKEKIKLQQQDDFNEYDKRMGILSLTANPNRPEMWNKYSELNKGFCVGFSSEILFKFIGGGGVVNYCKELPTIMPTPWDSHEVQHFKQAFFKTDNWEFEEEYRTTRFSYTPFAKEERIITIPKDAYREVIFGYDIDENIKEQITIILQNKIPNIQLRQAKYVDGKIEI